MSTRRMELRAAAHLAALLASLVVPKNCAAQVPGLPLDHSPVVTVVESRAMPVIGRETAAAAGILGGFETGNVIKEPDGMYHMFVGEKANPTTYPWKMGWCVYAVLFVSA